MKIDGFLSMGKGEPCYTLTGCSRGKHTGSQVRQRGIKSEFHQNMTLSLASFISRSYILRLVLKNVVRSRIILVRPPEQHLDTEGAH